MSHLPQIVSAVFSAFGIAFIVWLFWRSFKRSSDRPRLMIKWIFTGLVLWFVFARIVPDFQAIGPGMIYGLFVMVVVGIALAATWRHSLIDILANPLGSLYDGGNIEVDPKPYYSVALSKRKLNKPLEAIVEVRQQLDKFPNDYEGVLLLAGIQAEDLKDLPSAEMTVNHFCEWEEAPPRQVAAALTQLADWHLKIIHDVDYARVTLERIIEKFPDTELSNAAAERIAHLGGAEKILLSAQDRRPVFLPVGVQSAGLRETMRDLVPEERDPEKVTEELVKHLQEHPLDAEARERLAILYARHHLRLDLATHELAQLAEQPGQPAKCVAHWLNLLADLQIHGGADFETVRPTLEKIIELYPDLPVADIARRRLSIVKLEIKGQQKESPAKVLGEYEQNIGLKSHRIYSPREL